MVAEVKLKAEPKQTWLKRKGDPGGGVKQTVLSKQTQAAVNLEKKTLI